MTIGFARCSCGLAEQGSEQNDPSRAQFFSLPPSSLRFMLLPHEPGYLAHCRRETEGDSAICRFIGQH
jgi:hypothetical protein